MFNASLLQSSVLLNKKSITPLKLSRFSKFFFISLGDVHKLRNALEGVRDLLRNLLLI